MATERQIEANRRNAQLSTGPRSSEGKDAVRRNALKHGLRAEVVDLIPGEDPEALSAKQERWKRSYQPITPMQAEILQSAVAVHWRIDRADRLEDWFLTDRINDAYDACIDSGGDGDDAIAAARRAVSTPGPELEKIRRYGFMLRRDLFRLLAELTKAKTQAGDELIRMLGDAATPLVSLFESGRPDSESSAKSSSQALNSSAAAPPVPAASAPAPAPAAAAREARPAVAPNKPNREPKGGRNRRRKNRHKPHTPNYQREEAAMAARIRANLEALEIRPAIPTGYLPGVSIGLG